MTRSDAELSAKHGMNMSEEKTKTYRKKRKKNPEKKTDVQTPAPEQAVTESKKTKKSPAKTSLSSVETENVTVAKTVAGEKKKKDSVLVRLVRNARKKREKN